MIRSVLKRCFGPAIEIAIFLEFGFSLVIGTATDLMPLTRSSFSDRITLLADFVDLLKKSVNICDRVLCGCRKSVFLHDISDLIVCVLGKKCFTNGCPVHFCELPGWGGYQKPLRQVLTDIRAREVHFLHSLSSRLHPSLVTLSQSQILPSDSQHGCAEQDLQAGEIEDSVGTVLLR